MEHIILTAIPIHRELLLIHAFWESSFEKIIMSLLKASAEKIESTQKIRKLSCFRIFVSS